MQIKPIGLCATVSLAGFSLLLAATAVWFVEFDGDTLVLPPNATLPDGSRYFGEVRDGTFHGEGKLLWPNGGRYEGDFDDGLFEGFGVLEFANGGGYEGKFYQGQMSGQGVLRYIDGTGYRGEFFDDMPHGDVTVSFPDGSTYTGQVEAFELSGQGRLVQADGAAYEGTFVEGQIVEGHYADTLGNEYKGDFQDWIFHGEGEYTDASGNRYRGTFENGNLTGEGTVTLADGGMYKGGLENWAYNGEGTLTDAKGNQYTGEFSFGQYHGRGEMVYAEPVDGVESITGEWRFGRPKPDPVARRERQKALEAALYTQADLLKESTDKLLAGTPGNIDLYFLGIAGDDSQDVFLKEIKSVQALFDNSFATKQRSLTLINHHQTLASTALATQTSLSNSLEVLAQKMDVEEDVLFLYVTSHGSSDHKLSFNLNGLNLPSLTSEELATTLKDSGIKWKVVVISACYSGGLLPSLEDDNTLVMTAARADRTSFGCGEDDDMTYFGRALFEEALPNAHSFAEAFQKAEELIHKKEREEYPDGKHSEPQISEGSAIRMHLQRWWSQRDSVSVATGQ